MNKKITTYFASIALTALLITGCGGTNSNAPSNANSNRSANTNNSNSTGISLPNVDLEKVKEEAAKLGSKIGTGTNDGWIWTQIRAKFLADSDLRTLSINIDVDNDVVTLRGTVESEAAKTKATQIAQGVNGVKSVTNNLQVSGAKNTNSR